MGTSYQVTRRLITAVVAPTIDYAAIIWHRPENYGQSSRPPQHQTRIGRTKGDEGSIGHFPNNGYIGSQNWIWAHCPLSTTPKLNDTRIRTTRHATTRTPTKSILTGASKSQSDIFISPLEHLSRTFPEHSQSRMETIQPPTMVDPYRTHRHQLQPERLEKALRWNNTALNVGA